MKEYLEKTKKVLAKIESFDQYFSENSCSPEYTIAWEKNRSHGISLNALKPESALYLYNLVLDKKPTTILEIGAGGGYSTIVMADALTQLSAGGHVYTIEKSLPKIEIVKVHIKESGLENITLIEGDSREILTKNKIIDGEKFDLVFIDADRKRYKDFLQLCESRLNNNAMVIADNITSHPEDVQDFIKYISENPNYEYEIIDIGSGLLVASYLSNTSSI